MSTAPVRIVTGHNDRGDAVISSAGVPPTVKHLESVPGVVFYELWRTTETPAVLDSGVDPTLGGLRIKPTPGGTVMRMIDYPPDSEEFLAMTPDDMGRAFVEMGAPAVSTLAESGRHPGMHRTESIDYAVVMSGTITLLVDHDEVECEAGTVVVQRGTNHGWANRSGSTARVLFVLIDGRYAESQT